jgi:hypothetical protein
MLRPLAESSVGKPPSRHHINGIRLDMSLEGMMRNPMRRLGTYISALSAAAAWSFNRPSDRCVMRVESGCLSHTKQQSGIRLSKSD